MSLYSFRTEGPDNRAGVEKMLEVLSLTLVNHWQDGESEYRIADFFTVESEDDLEDIRDRMMFLVKRDVECFKAGESYELLPFVDLYRCPQTLDRGTEPKDPFDPPRLSPKDDPWRVPL
jgi:hypothetical protein